VLNLSTVTSVVRLRRTARDLMVLRGVTKQYISLSVAIGVQNAAKSLTSSSTAYHLPGVHLQRRTVCTKSQLRNCCCRRGGKCPIARPNSAPIIQGTRTYRDSSVACLWLNSSYTATLGSCHNVNTTICHRAITINPLYGSRWRATWHRQTASPGQYYRD